MKPGRGNKGRGNKGRGMRVNCGVLAAAL